MGYWLLFCYFVMSLWIWWYFVRYLFTFCNVLLVSNFCYHILLLNFYLRLFEMFFVWFLNWYVLGLNVFHSDFRWVLSLCVKIDFVDIVYILFEYGCVVVILLLLIIHEKGGLLFSCIHSKLYSSLVGHEGCMNCVLIGYVPSILWLCRQRPLLSLISLTELVPMCLIRLCTRLFWLTGFYL